MPPLVLIYKREIMMFVDVFLYDIHMYLLYALSSSVFVMLGLTCLT